MPAAICPVTPVNPVDMMVIGLENGVTGCFDVDSSGVIVVVSARHRTLFSQKIFNN